MAEKVWWSKKSLDKDINFDEKVKGDIKKEIEKHEMELQADRNLIHYLEEEEIIDKEIEEDEELEMQAEEKHDKTKEESVEKDLRKSEMKKRELDQKIQEEVEERE